MARKKKEPTVQQELTREEKIERAMKSFYQLVSVPVSAIATPTRVFNVGDEVQVGNLNNCRVAEVLENHKLYVIEHDSLPDRQNRWDPPLVTRTFGLWWWVDVEYPHKPNGESWFRPALRGNAITTGLSSIIHMYRSDGLVCNPEYQRDYVWTDHDREMLLDTMFDRMEIGSFVFLRNKGFNHERDETIVQYKSLTGDDVNVKRCENYTVEIIDGQQRLTTIVRFMLDMFRYRGKLFSELSWRDQHEIEEYSVQYRLVEAESVSRREILQMFLKVNRGVPQTTEHLDRIRKLLSTTE